MKTGNRVHNNNTKTITIAQGQTHPEFGQDKTPSQDKNKGRKLADALEELDNALAQSDALGQLMLIAIDSPHGVQFVSGENGRCAWGIQSLLSSAHEKRALSVKKIQALTHQLNH